MCSILCFGFADFVLDFVLRICGFCARFCASDMQILCLILCFGVVGFVLDVVLRICGFCARFCASDLRIVLNLVLAGIQHAEIRSTRNQDLEHEKSGNFLSNSDYGNRNSGAPGPWFWCSRPLFLVLPALGSGAPGPWFCGAPGSRPCPEFVVWPFLLFGF